MAELIGLVASAIQVTASGISVSRTLRDYGSAVQGSEKRLKGLDNDIYFTSNIISELATLLKDPRVQASVSERCIGLTRKMVAEFEAMFKVIEDVIEGIRTDGLGKWKIYFREPKIGLLLSDLDRLKGNLQLLIGVITHGLQISAGQQNDATTIPHRIKLLKLMLEKEESTQKYLEEKRKYERLVAQVRSTNTIGGVSAVQTSHSVARIWGNGIISEETGTPYQFDLDELPESGGKGKGVANTESAEATMATFRENEIPENGASSEAASTDDALLLEIQLARLRDKAEYIMMKETNMQVASRQPRKRETAAKVGKKIAKGTGYIATRTAALILFPITIGVLLCCRFPSKRRQRNQSYGGGINYYESRAIPAELPGPHELMDTNVDLGLVAELTTYRIPGH